VSLEALCAFVRQRDGSLRVEAPCVGVSFIFIFLVFHLYISCHTPLYRCSKLFTTSSSSPRARAATRAACTSTPLLTTVEACTLAPRISRAATSLAALQRCPRLSTLAPTLGCPIRTQLLTTTWLRRTRLHTDAFMTSVHSLLIFNMRCLNLCIELRHICCMNRYQVAHRNLAAFVTSVHSLLIFNMRCL